MGPGHSSINKARRRISKGFHDCDHTISLQLVIDGFHLGSLHWIATKQWVVWINLFQIAADRHNLTNTGAIIQLEHRHLTQGINAEKLLGQLLAAHQIDLNRIDFYPFFSHQYSDSPRTGGCSAIIEFHGLASYGYFMARPGSFSSASRCSIACNMPALSKPVAANCCEWLP